MLSQCCAMLIKTVFKKSQDYNKAGKTREKGSRNLRVRKIINLQISE